MSIYATCWEISVEVYRRDVRVWGQSVPGHIGHPDEDYEEDYCREFLPPLIEGHDPDTPRAMVIVSELSNKGTDRSNQEYEDPILVCRWEEYEAMGFDEVIQLIHTEVRKQINKTK